uniref:Peptidyl-tRNA hydrolase n=2 Tax=Thermus tengchongensis TaxID=1214928 RepID=A0A7C6A0B0_9DEIN
MFLVVGQGNPGERYARTRHNLGFMVLDRMGLEFRKKGEALLAEAEVEGEKGLFLKPLTYYNLSGQAVAPLVRFYHIPPERLLVVHDEMDLPLGRLRFKAGGSAAGNRGVASIAEAFGTEAFHRLRLGIGKPPSRERGAEYVLSPFLPEEWPVVERVLEAAKEAVLCWVREGLPPCAGRFNGMNLSQGLGEKG